MGTARYDSWNGSDFPEYVVYSRGQREIGAGGFDHWQFFIQCKSPVRLSKLKRWIGDGHWEPARSEHAINYVWKEDTRVEGSQFEHGSRALKRNSHSDWDIIRERALAGDITNIDIPGDVFIRYYSQLKYNPFLFRSIAKDFARPTPMQRSCVVYWGSTGLGKSRRAWHEAGNDAYVKDPLTKWWEGYQGQANVIIDEFRGIISIAHILRWLDRYPVNVECKGGSTPLRTTRYWITSNIHPRSWYPELDEPTYKALERRMEIIEIEEPWEPIESEELIEVSE